MLRDHGRHDKGLGRMTGGKRIVPAERLEDKWVRVRGRPLATDHKFERGGDQTGGNNARGQTVHRDVLGADIYAQFAPNLKPRQKVERVNVLPTLHEPVL